MKVVEVCFVSILNTANQTTQTQYTNTKTVYNIRLRTFLKYIKIDTKAVDSASTWACPPPRNRPSQEGCASGRRPVRPTKTCFPWSRSRTSRPQRTCLVCCLFDESLRRCLRLRSVGELFLGFLLCWKRCASIFSPRSCSCKLCLDFMLSG